MVSYGISLGFSLPHFRYLAVLFRTLVSVMVEFNCVSIYLLSSLLFMEPDLTLLDFFICANGQWKQEFIAIINAALELAHNYTMGVQLQR